MKGLASLRGWLSRRRRARKRLRMLDGADVVVVSTGKSGRTWLRAMISHVYHLKYGIAESELINFDNFHRIDRTIPKIFFTHDVVDEPWNLGRPLNGDPFRDKKVLLLVRDPRDVAVSMYFHVAKRSRAEARARRRLPEDMLRDLPIFDFILGAKYSRLPRHVAFLNRWLERIRAHPRSLVVRYEDMHADPARILRRVMEFIGGDVTERQIDGAVAFASFENLRARERQGFFRGGRLRAADPDDPDSYKVRRGKVGGYRDYLTPDQVARVDAFVASRLDPFYGYAAAGAGHRHEEAQMAGPTMTTAGEGAAAPPIG